MTIDELIARLEDYREQLGGDTEVRLMTQQHWPFENGIAGLASTEEVIGCDNGEDPCADEDAAVFIVEGPQRCYGSKRAWDVAY